MKIADYLKKENNNLDVVRLILASLVIYSHVPVFVNPQGHDDVFSKWLQIASSGEVAVTSFFFISGLLVSNSLFTKRDYKKYLVARFFRLMPGLLVVSIFMALVGLYFTDMGARQYFPLALEYVKNNISLHIQFEIYGVSFMHEGFNDPLYSKGLNGSLWTIPYEVYMYLLVMSIFFVAKCIDNRIITVVLLLGTFSPVFGAQANIFGNPLHRFMIPAFFLGALFAYYKTKIDLEWYLPVAFLLTGYILVNPEAHNWFMMMGTVLGFMCLASSKWFRMIKLPRDLSYGVYLFGWPAEQLCCWFFPQSGMWFFLCISIFAALLMAFVLNVLVEVPSQKLSRYLCNKIG